MLPPIDHEISDELYHPGGPNSDESRMTPCWRCGGTGIAEEEDDSEWRFPTHVCRECAGYGEVLDEDVEDEPIEIEG